MTIAETYAKVNARPRNERRSFYDGMEQERQRARERYNEEEIKKWGTKTYQRNAEVYPSTVTVVPVEIEVSSELDSFVKAEILDGFYLTYPEWITKCYKERIQQILSNHADPAWKDILESKKSGHSINNADDLELKDC